MSRSIRAHKNGAVRVRRARGAAAIAGILAVLAGLPAAIAQTQPTTGPEIDRAPSRVAFRAAVTVAGHVDGFELDDEVQLQRRDPKGTWRTVAIAPVSREGRFVLRAERVRVTALYRVYWSDPAEQQEATSETVRVDVEPMLRVRARPNDVYMGRAVTITGELYPKVTNTRRVALQQWVRGAWRPLGRVRVNNARFRFRFTPEYRSHRTIRAIFYGGELNTRAVAATPVRVYENDLATWYGPGFYGNSTACGQRLGYDTLGVAHRTLPCGTRVSLFYRGRSITVRVIDRGPYTSAEWDLTGETARRLGFSGKEYVGVAY